jgi:myo-inositol-1(or 4)-monophosphatase
MGERAARAELAAEAGAEVALEAFRTAMDVETKGAATDVVTATDREAQRSVASVLREGYPDDPIVGEEDDEPSTLPSSGPAWVVDPIDGTNNFVRGLRHWATSVAATVDGETVGAATVCPALGDAYVFDGETATRNGEVLSVSDRADPEAFTVVPSLWWDHDRRDEYAATCRAVVERFGDMRRFGAAQIELGLCAAGGVDAVVSNVRGHPWDTVAGVALVEAAGGVVTDVEGEPWEPGTRGLVASNGEIHDVVLAAAREAERDR